MTISRVSIVFSILSPLQTADDTLSFNCNGSGFGFLLVASPYAIHNNIMMVILFAFSQKYYFYFINYIVLQSSHGNVNNLTILFQTQPSKFHKYIIVEIPKSCVYYFKYVQLYLIFIYIQIPNLKLAVIFENIVKNILYYNTIYRYMYILSVC